MDDYDYAAEEDIIEYNGDDYDIPMEDNQCGINLEDMFISAESSTNPEDEFIQIIELEKDNSTDCKWSYKSYEKLCLLYIKEKNVEKFQNSFNKLFELYSRIDDMDKQDTIRHCTYNLNDQEDKNFVVEALGFMLELLKEKGIDRAVMDTGIQYAKTLSKLNKNEELGLLLKDLLQYDERLDQNDIIYKSIRLELIVMSIIYYNFIKDYSEVKNFYLKAEKLSQDQIVQVSRLSAIINEEGGKIHMRIKNYEVALEKFKSAFYSYQQSGNNRAGILLKYSILCTMITKNSNNIVSNEESSPYLEDKSLVAILELQSAYEENNIHKVKEVWFNKVLNRECDEFILELSEDIFHNILIKYVSRIISLYSRILFSTLEYVNKKNNFNRI